MADRPTYEQLQAKRARAEADRARLDWIQNSLSGIYYHMSGIGPMWEITSIPSECRYAYNTAREAIDAAMKQALADAGKE